MWSYTIDQLYLLDLYASMLMGYCNNENVWLVTSTHITYSKSTHKYLIFHKYLHHSTHTCSIVNKHLNVQAMKNNQYFTYVPCRSTHISYCVYVYHFNVNERDIHLHVWLNNIIWLITLSYHNLAHQQKATRDSVRMYQITESTL